MMGKLRLTRPRLRGRGGYEAPEEDGVEPARTERVLGRAFCFSPRWPWRCGLKGEHAGDVLETLPMWTDDAGERKGLFYVYVQVLIQMVIAMQVGILFAHPFNQTSTGGLVNLSGLIFMQALLVVWVASHTANDLYTATENLLCFLVELAATCLLLIANQIAAHADGDPGKLATSLELATVSLQLLIYSCWVPLIFTVYDSFVVPVVQFCWKSDDLSYSETCCQMVVTLILLPITIASTFSGASTNAGADLLGNAEGTLVGSSSQAKNLVAGQEEAPDAAEPDAAAPDAHVPPSCSKAARKRLKRTTFLERVRTKMEALKAAQPATTDDNGTPPTIFEVAGRQAAVAM